MTQVGMFSWNKSVTSEDWERNKIKYNSFVHYFWPYYRDLQPWYNWNVVESGVKHHNPNPIEICWQFVFLCYQLHFVDSTLCLNCENKFLNVLELLDLYLFSR
jgi:hypothetical protein